MGRLLEGTIRIKLRNSILKGSFRQPRPKAWVNWLVRQGSNLGVNGPYGAEAKGDTVSQAFGLG